MPGAETGDALDHRGSGDSAVEEEVEDAGVDRNAVMLCSVAEVEGDFNGLPASEHGMAPL
jgi:hypothetical protein